MIITNITLQSNEIHELVKALIKAKKNIKKVRVDDESNFGKFVSLDQIRDDVEGHLLEQGLVFTQTRFTQEGIVYLYTRLFHDSGQFIGSVVPLLIPENAQSIDKAYGSAMSYQRRYELYGLLGLGKGEDNDPDKEEHRSSHKPALPSNNNQLSAVKLSVLFDLLSRCKPETEKALCQSYGIKTLAQLDWRKFDEVKDILEGLVSPGK
jgi:ERF superfamily